MFTSAIKVLLTRGSPCPRKSEIHSLQGFVTHDKMLLALISLLCYTKPSTMTQRKHRKRPNAVPAPSVCIFPAVPKAAELHKAKCEKWRIGEGYTVPAVLDFVDETTGHNLLYSPAFQPSILKLCWRKMFLHYSAIMHLCIGTEDLSRAFTGCMQAIMQQLRLSVKGDMQEEDAS